MATFPARIHAILAAGSPRGVVIRRGPSKQVAVIGWNTATDEFTLGQWLMGRIYERRCDISPDGSYFLYFAMGGGSDSFGTWSAISRTPYLRALALWPKGDAWNGGGLFLGKDRFWLNAGCSDKERRGDVPLERVEEYPWHEGYGGECPGVYYVRLQRSGWDMKHTAPGGGGEITTFEKPVAGHWRLRKLAYATPARRAGRGCYFDEHQIVNARTGEVIDRPDWEWAEVDGERLVWAEGGRMYAGLLSGRGIEARELFDFNPMKFEAIKAPYD